MRNALNGLKVSVLWILPCILIIALVAPAAGESLAPAGKPGKGISHTARQEPPVQLGTSGGWDSDLANGYCCGGTLGSLVQDADRNQYILSNYHVFAGDVDKSDQVWSQIGALIIQPGLIDVGCNKNNAQPVAVLSDWADPLAATN